MEFSVSKQISQRGNAKDRFEPLEATKTHGYPVGSLVAVRGREWVVLPSDDDEVLMLRPLTGREHEVCGVYFPLEGHAIQPAHFPRPEPHTAGDFIAGSLLRDAARLSLRSSAAPLRSLGTISVRPKPYQLVPLMMALRLDPVRLLIADDVGVGKTIEAALIARELLDRGEIQRLCVLCPPHLCDQWERELREKFHVHPVVVRSNTEARLYRDVPRKDLSVYRYFPHLVVSIDYVKLDRRRDAFLADCPDFVIVDEAHTAAQPGGTTARDQQLRHDLVDALAADSTRHLVLLTATPHSGVQESFQSLLSLVHPDFEGYDVGRLADRQRARLARHYVQRLRGDILRWADEETRLPKRDPKEEDYPLSQAYTDLFDHVLAFTRETVAVPSLPQRRQRVRYWAALALLRCVMSSPAAAEAALRARLGTTAEGEEGDDDLRQWQVLDPIREEGTIDVVPDTVVAEGERDLEERDRRRLRDFARRAAQIRAQGADQKVEKADKLVADLLRQGYHPIVYCRFIETAKYVAEELSARLRSRFPDVHVIAVTSETGSDEEREARVEELKASPVRVLVATDCLSEGVNLQDGFDAVLHYDLPWNPNRLEQREGRVDRFGQTQAIVPAILLYGRDNRIDLIVLDVLIRKAHEIYRSTGVRVPVPVESESVMQALAQALFERLTVRPEQVRLDLEDLPTVGHLHQRWETYAEREKEHRSRFAQHAINPEEVMPELRAADAVLGGPQTVRSFLLEAAQRLPLPIQPRNGHLILEPTGPLKDVTDHLGWKKSKRLVFTSPLPPGLEGSEVVDRNHPLVTWITDRILGKAFSPRPERQFARCGAAYTAAVRRRTALLLLRLRYKLERRGGQDMFAEEVITVAMRSTTNDPEWIAPDSPDALVLLEATPVGSISQAERTQQVQWALHALDRHGEGLIRLVQERAKEVERAHERLRQQVGGRRVRVTVYEPDILGVYVLLPGGTR